MRGRICVLESGRGRGLLVRGGLNDGGWLYAMIWEF